MNRPPLEVADLVRAAGRAFIERSRKWITWQHLKVLRAIARCRTAALGGHLDQCTDCAYRPPISYNSCRDPALPKVSGQRSRPLAPSAPSGTSPHALRAEWPAPIAGGRPSLRTGLESFPSSGSSIQ